MDVHWYVETLHGGLHGSLLLQFSYKGKTANIWVHGEALLFCMTQKKFDYKIQSLCGNLVYVASKVALCASSFSMQSSNLLDLVVVIRQPQALSISPSPSISASLTMLISEALLPQLTTTLPPLWLPYQDPSPHQNLMCHSLVYILVLPTQLRLKL